MCSCAGLRALLLQLFYQTKDGWLCLRAKALQQAIMKRDYDAKNYSPGPLTPPIPGDNGLRPKSLRSKEVPSHQALCLRLRSGFSLM